jgi:hypothetical protein
MVTLLGLTLAGTAGAAVVINEILYDPMGVDDGQERIELYNNGGTGFDLAGHSLCNFPAYWDLPAMTLASGEYLVIRWNTTGTDGPLEFYTGPTFKELSATDQLGLYIGTVASSPFGNPAAILDYVQWGVGNQAGRAGVAETAGIWLNNDFLAAVAEGVSLALFPDGDDRNDSSNWSGLAPSFGGGNAVPVEATTWGRIKELYQ